MDARPGQPRVSVSSPAGVIAVIPRLLGFAPEASLVVLGLAPPGDRVRLVFRYDLPGPSGTYDQAAIAEHAASILGGSAIPAAIVAGYGPDALVSPVIDAIRAAARSAGLRLRDALRVHEGRYWSCLCPDLSCCSAEGTALDAVLVPPPRSWPPPACPRCRTGPRWPPPSPR
jgi:hypothetical protein